MQSEYWAWILFPYKHFNYRLNLGIYILYIPGGFVFPIKALEICIYIETDYDTHEPRPSLLLLHKKKYNIIYSISIIIVLLYVSGVKPGIFPFLTPSTFMSPSI